MIGTPLTPAVNWDAVRATPDGAALADAYQTVLQELKVLIVYAQGADTGAGMTPAALRDHAETLIPRLSEPNGKRWTEEYYAATSAASVGATHLRRYLADRAEGHRSDHLVEFAIEALTKGAK